MKRFFRFKILILSFIIISILFISIGTIFTDNKKEVQADCTWTGTWSSNYGKMILTQTGNTVTGTYEYSDGRINGTVNGNKLIGTWEQSSNNHGDFEFTMSSDCNSFIGKWRYPNGSWHENDWKGTRLSDNPPPSSSKCTWSGTWNTSFGKMYLIQSGNKVSGNYELDNGKIEGTINENKLIGKWSESPSYSPPNDVGDFEFTMSSDCKSFTGKWRYDSTGNWSNIWTGTKISDTVPSQNPDKPPRGLRAYPGNNKVYLEWDQPEDTKNLLGYYIYRAKFSGGYSSPAHDFYITNTNYIDENVENGTTYYYICKVVYNDKSQSPPSNEVMVTPKPLSPVINISDNQKVTNSKFTFTGKVDVNSEVYVNGNKVDVDSNGNFTATVTLVKGTNTIKIEVKNKAGDTITITKTVIYEETQPPPNPPSGTLTIILQINNPQMIVNGVKKEIDPGRGTVPVIVKGRTLVPIRAIIEEMGGEISWDGTERKVTIKLKSKILELWIDKKSAKANGVVKELDVPPQIINGRTMLPLRFVTEELGCTVDWDGTTKTITITYKKEQTNINEDINKISAEGEKIFGSSGGELILSDGTKLIVSQNSFSSDTKVTLKSIINPTFYSKDALGFEITGLKELKGEITLYSNGPKGLKSDALNIFGYDHEKDEKIDLNFNYDSSTGLVIIKISPSISLSNKFNFLCSNYVINSYSKILGFTDKLAVYVGWMPYYTPKSNEKIIRMPYYEQIGGSCASTSAQMLIKHSGKDIELFDILKELRPSDTDFGLNSDLFANSLRDFISQKIGFTTNHIPYFAIPHLKWKILSELDKGNPVILNWGKHVVLVLGYRNNGDEIIIHDPQNISPATGENGTMYTVRTWDWIRSRHKVATEKYYIIYPEGTFASSPSLSLMCPGNDETGAMSAGEIAFYITHPNTKKLTSFYELQIKPSDQKDGYIWLNKQTKQKIDSISEDADVLKLKLNAYNGSTYIRDIEIQTAIEEDKEGNPGKKISSHNQKFSLGEAKLNNASKVIYEYEYKVEDLRDYSLSDKDGKEKILIHATLWEDTSLRDYFIIKVTLNILPKVSSINPTTGKGGDTITINGFSFGKVKSTKSKVMIGNKLTEILSWIDKEIKVKLPQDIESGPVIVYTGEKYEYESNKDIFFNTAPKCDGFSEVYGTTPSWSNIDCKWETSNRLIRLCLQFKNGQIKGDGTTCYSSYQEVSGTYDNNGNVNFTFTWKSPETNDNYGYIVTGNFSGKFVKGCIFYGTATGKVRVYNKNPMYCKAYDIEKDFSSLMYDKNYKP